MLKNLGIKHQLLIASGVTILLIIIFSIAAVINLKSISSYQSEAGKRANEGITAAKNSRIGYKVQTSIDDLIYSNADEESKTFWIKVKQEAEKEVKEISALSDNDEERLLSSKAHSLFQLIFTETDNELLPMIANGGDIANKLHDFDKKIGDRIVEIQNLMRPFRDSLVDENKLAIDIFQKKISYEITFIVILSISMVVFIVFAMAIIIRNITKSLNQISMQLLESSSQITRASEQLSEASNNISQSANEQASAVEETSASLEEMNNMIANNLANAEGAKNEAEKVNSIASKGNHSMEMLVRSMTEILEANSNIDRLVKVISEIGDKTRIIDEIVFQTKLLSFNASVEAERAGEHGRGFAVVAQEVGNLAQMSGKAALEISGIVKESVKSAEEITKENKDKVHRGNELVKNTAELLNETKDKVNNVSIRANEVVVASKEQSTGIQQITNAMEQLNKITQENASASEETASASEELSAQAISMKQLVEDLNTLILGNTRS